MFVTVTTLVGMTDLAVFELNSPTLKTSGRVQELGVYMFNISRLKQTI